MVAPPGQQSTPLQPAETNSQAQQHVSSGDGPRYDGDSENARPAGWTENPAAAAAAGARAGGGAGAAGAAGGAGSGAGGVSGVLGIGPEVDDDDDNDNESLHSRVDAPLSQRQRQDAMAAAGALRANMAWGQQYAGGAIRGGESKRASSEVEVEMWKLGLHINSRLDVKDTVDKWCEAEVLAVDREAAKVFITYTFWAKKVCVVFVGQSTKGSVMRRSPIPNPNPSERMCTYAWFV